MHWTNAGAHRVAQTDRQPRNGTPDYVDKVLGDHGARARTYVRAGYRAPRQDTGRRQPERDIYLGNIGPGPLRLLHHRPAPERAGHVGVLRARQRLRDCEFPTNTPLENMQVTAAHEYFHAVQFAYDFFEDGWFMEATATWAEDELYDDVNDNVQYLPIGPLGRPIPAEGWTELRAGRVLDGN